jgi:S1-C subfamily serine protease
MNKIPKHIFHGVLASLLLLLFLCPATALAGKAYIWRDKDGKIHFSSQKPHPTQTGGDIKEREFKEPPAPKKDEEATLPKSPIEHAVLCTFRLKNKKGGASGFFINDKGMAITAKHVVKGVTYSMKAELPGHKRKYRVRVVKKSRKHDLALLQVAIDKPTPFLEIRDPKTLVPGEDLWAVGNPLLAFKETVTKGIFSRIFPEKDIKKELKMKRTRFKYRGDWVQFSAPVTFGNSGGPVFDKEGKLVGVVSWGVMVHEALNFAVPSSYILEDFKSHLE